MAKEFKLEVGELPPVNKNGLYDTIVADFIKQVLDNSAAPQKSAKVTIPNRKIKTVQIGLAKAVTSTKRRDITVTIRNNEVWMTKK